MSVQIFLFVSNIVDSWS